MAMVGGCNEQQKSRVMQERVSQKLHKLVSQKLLLPKDIFASPCRHYALRGAMMQTAAGNSVSRAKDGTYLFRDDPFRGRNH